MFALASRIGEIAFLAVALQTKRGRKNTAKFSEAAPP